MNKKKKLAENSKEASAQILEIKAILIALSDLEQSMAIQKIKKVFYCIEESRQIVDRIG